MTQTPIEHIRHPRLLDLAVYLTMIVMASISLVLVPDPATRVVAIALGLASRSDAVERANGAAYGR
jgi:hypothetical protein